MHIPKCYILYKWDSEESQQTFFKSVSRFLGYRVPSRAEIQKAKHGPYFYGPVILVDDERAVHSVYCACLS